MTKFRFYLFISLLFITGCTHQPQPYSAHSNTENAYSLESIAYAYQQKANHE